MVEEAVSRMCRLGMMPQVITKFRKQGTVLKSETVGILYDLNDEEKKAVADWEEKSGGIVYAAILSNMVFGRCLALLYVSAEEEEWELDREDLEEAIRSTGLEVTQERVDKLLEECHRIFDDKSGRNEILAQKASKLFEEE